MALFAVSCAQGFDDEETFSGGVTNSQVESPVGQRRDRIEFRLQDQYNYTDGTSGRTWSITSSVAAERDANNPDPIIKLMSRADRDAYAVDLSESAIKKTPLAEQLETLKGFYQSYLKRRTYKGDKYDSNNNQLTMTWKPHYYF